MGDLLAGFAVYRLTRLAVEDALFDEQRQRVQVWLGERSDFALKLVSCGYCLSVWIAAAEVATRQTKRRPLRSWMAVAGVAAAAWSVDRLAASLES